MNLHKISTKSKNSLQSTPSKSPSKYTNSKLNLDESDDIPGHLGCYTRQITNTILTVPMDQEFSNPSYYRFVCQAISELEEGDTVEFEVASDGGRVDGLIALLSALERTPATSVALLNGMAASAASILALNCDMVWVGTNSSMMIHNAHFGSIGTVSNVVKHVDFERKRTEKLIRSTYEHFLTEDEIEAVLAGVEIWLDSEEINDRLIIKASILEELSEEDDEDCSSCNDCHNTELQYDPVSVAFKHQEDKVISDKVWEQVSNNQSQQDW